MNFDIVNGIQKFVQLINDNWTLIIIVVGLIVTLVERVRKYLELSDQEKIEAIKALIKNTILENVTNAEIEYEEWVKAGAIKRAQVIGEIYEKYPVLYTVVDQEGLIKWLDNAINEALETMRKIFEENSETE